MNDKYPKFISGIYGSSLAYYLTQIPEKQILVISQTEEISESLVTDTNTFLPNFDKGGMGGFEGKAVLFPDLNKIEGLSASKEIIGARLKIFIDLEKGKNLMVFASIKSAEEIDWDCPRMGTVPNNLITLKTGEILDVNSFIDKIIKNNYERNYLIERKGDWSMRGGIIDIYPIEFDYPVRIELEGNKISSIRSFDVFTQRTEKILPSIEVFLGNQQEDNSKSLLSYFRDRVIVMKRIDNESMKDHKKII